MITLDTIDSSLHSIMIKDAAGDALAIGADGSINITDNGGSLTVDGTVELGATTLAALENIVVSGTVELGATTLAALESITVVATDLDIRDLNSASDSVAAVQSGAWTVAVSGDVNVTQGTSPWVIGDGGGSLTVDASDLDIRNLVFATDKVDVSGSVIETVEGGYDTWSVSAVSVTTTESTVSALGSRLRVEIQNLGSNDIYIKEATGVSSANGLKIPKGSSYEQCLDAGAAIYMVAATGTSDVRIAQYAA